MSYKGRSKGNHGNQRRPALSSGWHGKRKDKPQAEAQMAPNKLHFPNVDQEQAADLPKIADKESEKPKAAEKPNKEDEKAELEPKEAENLPVEEGTL